MNELQYARHKKKSLEAELTPPDSVEKRQHKNYNSGIRICMYSNSKRERESEEYKSESDAAHICSALAKRNKCKSNLKSSPKMRA